MKVTGLILLSALLCCACVKDRPTVQTSSVVQLSTGKKVFIVNEGNFGSGNASVSLFDPVSSAVVDDIYKNVNGGSPGDVAQSLCKINGSLYLVMNNSGKIIVCDEQMKKRSEIAGLHSPRYILPVSNSKAYVTDLYSKSVNIIDLAAGLKTGSIPFAGWTEKMEILYAKVFVSCPNSNYLFVVNAQTDKVSDSVWVGKGANSLLLDKNDKLWVLAGGDVNKKTQSRLSRINATTLQTEIYFDFPLQQSPSSLCQNKTKDTLYFTNGSIFRMGINSTTLPVSAWVQASQKNFYGLACNPNDFSIYASDALDYVQRSNVYIYNTAGSEIKTFKAGINANSFYFE